MALGADADSRLEADRGLFRPHCEVEALTEIRLGVQQNQPVGSRRFLNTIEGMPGQRREPKSRGWPRKSRAGEGAISASGGGLTID
jgi:putative transposase